MSQLVYLVFECAAKRNSSDEYPLSIHREWRFSFLPRVGDSVVGEEPLNNACAHVDRIEWDVAQSRTFIMLSSHDDSEFLYLDQWCDSGWSQGFPHSDSA